jgi:hypothetical protein
MRTVLIHECSQPGCGALTIFGRCALHATADDVRHQAALDQALAALADAEERWLAAQQGGTALEIHVATAHWGAANAEVDWLEHQLGMVR